MSNNQDGERVTAIIVTYNPDISVFKDNLDSVLMQVRHAVIVDNNSKNIIAIRKLIKNNRKIHSIELKKNMGLAHALNLGVEKIIKTKASWVLTLDQDTVLDKNIIKRVMSVYHKLPEYEKRKAGILAIKPHEYKEHAILPKIIGNDYIGNTWVGRFRCKRSAITSGNIVKKELFKERALRFREDFFIDLIDCEFCNSVKKAGYSILEYEEAGMKHRIGIKSVKQERSFEPLFRLYYITRNSTYLLKRFDIGLRQYSIQIIFWSYRYIKIKSFGETPNVLKVIFLGLLDGFKGKLGRNTEITSEAKSTNSQARKPI